MVFYFKGRKLVFKVILIIICCWGEGSGGYGFKDSEKYL